MKSSVLKRLLDLVIGSAALIVTAPLIILVAAAVRVNLGRPVLFAQLRPGRYGQPFRLYKFRTMTLERDEQGHLLDDDLRLPSFGRWLRSLSLDELPQLFNVIRGDLSLVGPRPLLLEYMPLYSAEQARRHEVRPGITGWAQVNGRNAITWREKLRLDVWYVDHWTNALDLKILAMTLIRVVNRHGISQAGRATAERFTGNN
jgi:sugar transferase EpsL